MDDRWFKKDRESLSRAGSSSVGTREKDDLEDDQSAGFSNSVQRMPKGQFEFFRACSDQRSRRIQAKPIS